MSKKTEQVKSKSDYEKLLKGKSNSMESKGLMNLYWIENKIYMEIPKAVLGKRLLMGGVHKMKLMKIIKYMIHIVLII